nr:hypothetical protein [Kibdelosporangium sp. MJ126-NF4]CEL18633.1 hypothetical protein [Kibdelosporangium sp. MJ126-NF4]CTQ98118.1 hypothetical protein [Kibdelosporangium sp. MJ126-NF4]
MRGRTRRTLTISAVVGCVVALLSAPNAVADDVIETPVTGSTTGDGVTESYVSLLAPLPPSAGAHPAACDRIGYLRVRAEDGPADAADADAVYVSMPGFIGGAGSLEPMARNIVRASAGRGQHVEVWAIDRRANCLEDHLGLTAGAARRDPSLAFDYYVGKRQIDGHTYSPVTQKDAEFLKNVGLAQTVHDYRTVLDQLPPQVQRTKVLCGGHSLGGLITGALVNWDFGDLPGYQLCAGYYTLDTRLAGHIDAADLLAKLQQALPIQLTVNFSNLIGAAMPYVSVTPLTPDTLAMVMSFAQAAELAPDTPSTAPARIPRELNYDLSVNLFSARDLLGFLTGQPDLRKANATNAAVLGAVTADISSPIGFLRASIGAPTGTVVRKNFPTPYGSSDTAMGMVGGGKTVSPEFENGKLIEWRNYDQLPAEGVRTVDGDVYTTPASQVTDVHQFAATLANPHADGLEWFFPTRLAAESFEAQLGSRQGDLANLRYPDGIRKHPVINLDAAESGTVRGRPGDGGPVVKLEGYNHVDVGTAAWKQNNGKPEPLSDQLTEFVGRHVLTAQQ